MSSNKNLNNFIGKTGNSIRTAKGKYDSIKQMINETPISIKIANIAVPFTSTFVFTYIYYNLFFSIIFAIITFVVITLLSNISALIFIILYIVTIINVSNQRKITVGSPILQTDIVKNINNSPYNGYQNNLTIPSSSLLKDLNGGYFTYSFWLYLNGNDKDNNWSNYRNTEWKSIFYRGNAIDATGDLSSLIQFPGCWLTPILNNLVIVFQNGSYVERLEIVDIPINEWTNYAIVVETKSVSIYINGLLDRSLNLYQNITIMNGYNLYLTSDILTSTSKSDSGFAGNIAQLICYNYALSPTDIYKSYSYYKEILYKYQKKIDNKNKYLISNLITNSDIYK